MRAAVGTGGARLSNTKSPVGQTPPWHAADRQVSVPCPLSPGGCSPSAPEFHFGFVSPQEPSWHSKHILQQGLGSCWGCPVWELLGTLGEGSAVEIISEEDCSLSQGFPGWEMREPGLALPLLLREAHFSPSRALVPLNVPRHSLSHQFLSNTTQELSLGQTTPGTSACVTEDAGSHSLHFGMRMAWLLDKGVELGLHLAQSLLSPTGHSQLRHTLRKDWRRQTCEYLSAF